MQSTKKKLRIHTELYLWERNGKWNVELWKALQARAVKGKMIKDNKNSPLPGIEPGSPA